MNDDPAPSGDDNAEGGGDEFVEFMSMDEFCDLARQVVEEMPDEFQSWMEHVVVDVRKRPSRKQLKSVGIDPDGEDTLLGLYEGPGITNLPDLMGDTIANWAPHRVWLFKEPIEDVSRSKEEVAYEIKRTIIHELAHHFGWSEEDLDEFESQPNPFDEEDER